MKLNWEKPPALPRPLPKPMCRFASIIDDSNPVHLDPQYAKTTMFGERIAHGMHTQRFLLYTETKMNAHVISSVTPVEACEVSLTYWKSNGFPPSRE